MSRQTLAGAISQLCPKRRGLPWIDASFIDTCARRMPSRRRESDGRLHTAAISMCKLARVARRHIEHVQDDPDLARHRPAHRLRGALRINKRRHNRRADKPRSRKCRARRKLQRALRNRHHRRPRAACARLHAGAEDSAFGHIHARPCQAESVRARRTLVRPTRRRLCPCLALPLV